MPVAHDMSDLEEKILWARTHDIEASKMASAAGELTRAVLTEEFFDAFAAEVVRIYATEVYRSDSTRRRLGAAGAFWRNFVLGGGGSMSMAAAGRLLL